MISALRPRTVRILARLVLVPLLLLAPLPASAQVVATSFEELQTLVKAGDTIDVTAASGRKTKGRLGELSASSLELLVRKTGPDGRETFVPQVRLSERDVRQITLERRDSPLNGALIGLALGAAPGLIYIAGSQRGSDPIQWSSGVAFQVTMVPGAICAGIGALIDAAITDRATVYLSTGQRSSGVRLSPLLSKSAAGVQMSMRF